MLFCIQCGYTLTRYVTWIDPLLYVRFLEKIKKKKTLKYFTNIKCKNNGLLDKLFKSFLQKLKSFFKEGLSCLS